MAEHYAVATKAHLPRLKASKAKVTSIDKPNRAAAAKKKLISMKEL